MSNKRYFWLKLQSNFFDRDDVKLVEGMDNGKDYIIFYMKLILRSINSGGELRFKDTIPYNEKMLARLTDTNIDIVKSALNVFIELGMMERWDDGTLFMSETANMIGSETSSASRVRRHRDKQKQIDSDNGGQKALLCNTDETKSNTEIEKDIEKELDSDKDLDSDKKKKTSGDKSPSQKFDAMSYLIDQSVPYDLAEDFIKHRKATKSMITKRVIDNIASQAAKANYTLEQAIDTLITKGWKSFNADWVNKPQAGAPSTGGFNYVNKQVALEQSNMAALEEYRRLKAEGKL